MILVPPIEWKFSFIFYLFHIDGFFKCSALTRQDMRWLSENTHFDPDNISDWFKVQLLNTKTKTKITN